MGRLMKALTVTALLLLMLGMAEGKTPAGDAEKRSEAAIRLEIEPLLVDSEGLYPLNEAYEHLVEMGGSYHSIYKLGNGRGSLVYKLSYKMAGADTIELSLERSLERGGARPETMPALTHRMQVFETWAPTILEEEGSGTRLVLRVVPILRPPVRDVPLESGPFQMWLYGGPLIAFGNSAAEDRIIFRQVNVGGELQLGIPSVGEVRLSLRGFPGSAPCGAVRGHTLDFKLGGKSYRAYSTRPILPDDPKRPGGGWILYGSLDASVDVKRGYYGSLAP